MPCVEIARTATKANTQLRKELKNAKQLGQAVMVLSGDDAQTKNAKNISCLEVAVEQADGLPNGRVVVWIPEPAVLTPALRAKCTRPGAVAVLIDGGGKVAREFTIAQARNPVGVLDAFFEVEQQ